MAIEKPLKKYLIMLVDDVEMCFIFWLSLFLTINIIAMLSNNKINTILNTTKINENCCKN